MHSADLMISARLQRVYRVLSDGAEHSTRDLMWSADVCAVSTCVNELRANGCIINCRQEHTEHGRIWLYLMIQGHHVFDSKEASIALGER